MSRVCKIALKITAHRPKPFYVHENVCLSNKKAFVITLRWTRGQSGLERVLHILSEETWGLKGKHPRENTARRSVLRKNTTVFSAATKEGYNDCTSRNTVRTSEKLFHKCRTKIENMNTIKYSINSLQSMR